MLLVLHKKNCVFYTKKVVSDTVYRPRKISFKAPEQERFTRAKRLGPEYTEEEIKSRIERLKPPVSEKTLSKKPSHIHPQPQNATIPLKGIALWEKIISRTDTTEIYNLMQKHGGYNHFVDLMAESRANLETIDNGIKANKKRIAGLEYLRVDIVDLNRTRKIYKEYKTLKKSAKLFSKRAADKFYNTHEDTIRTHESALRELKDYKRPLPTLKELDENIAKGKKANITNKKYYDTAQAEYNRFTRVHRKLFDINHEHKPKVPQKQKQRSQEMGL